MIIRYHIFNTLTLFCNWLSGSHKIASILGEWILSEDSIENTLTLMRSHSDNQRSISSAKGELEQVYGKSG